MIRYRAAWVLPISQPPIRNGWVDVEEGRVTGVGGPGGPAGNGGLVGSAGGGDRSGPGDGDRDLGPVALLPGLVNAHTHLELSYLRDRVPSGGEFVTWIRAVMAERRLRPDPSSAEILEAVDRGIDEAVASGTALAGDISNTLVTFDRLARSPLAAVVFNEVIRFADGGAEQVVDAAIQRIRALTPTPLVRAALAAHAPYSVGPAVFRAIRRAADRDGLSPCSVHLAESRAEVEFIKAGSGPWQTLLEEVGAWDPTWMASEVSPVEYLDRHGFLDGQTIAVHGVQMSSADLARLASRGTTLVACPRSNAHTGAGVPPIEAFYASGVRVAVGTDSLASTADLNMFSELAAMRALAPAVAASALLASATSEGARALGFREDFGAIEPGTRARLLAVALPAGTRDVEEYLVSGIQPEAVRWIPETLD
jgi:aminodeoxyfutalosine deaminase